MDSADHPDVLDEILNSAGWGDYQKEDGSWGHGIANKPEIKAKIKSHYRSVEEIEAAMPKNAQPARPYGNFVEGWNAALAEIRKALGLGDDDE